MNFNTIKAGDVVDIEVGDRELLTSKFLGFTSIDEKYSTTPTFNTLKDVKQHYNVKTNRNLEQIGEHGHDVYAVFEEDGQSWGAYLFKGRWCCGSGANPIRLWRSTK